MSNAGFLANSGRVATSPISVTGSWLAFDRPTVWLAARGRRCHRQSVRRSLFVATAGSGKPTTRLRMRLHSAVMIGDPRLGIGFGGELADGGRIGLRDLHLDAE